jgi:hypothetical protein
MNVIEYLQNLPYVFTAEDAAVILKAHYKAPLKALEALERRGILLRMKRGHYAIAHAFDPLRAANLIHSPSYISFETALSFYGLIPERTELILSVVDGRPMTIQTPVGNFSYISQSPKLFALGMDLHIIQQQTLPIANREKAVLDTLSRANLKTDSITPDKILEYVVESLRVEEADLKKLSIKKMKAMAPLYRNLAPRKLVASLVKKKESFYE